MNDRIKIARGLHAGLLVRITRASIGVPHGSMGLIVKAYEAGPVYTGRSSRDNSITIYDVQLLGSFRTVRRMSQDLEVINESR